MKAYARAIVADVLGKDVIAIQRFSTGLSHYVFDVVADDHFSFENVGQVCKLDLRRHAIFIHGGRRSR